MKFAGQICAGWIVVAAIAAVCQSAPSPIKPENSPAAPAPATSSVSPGLKVRNSARYQLRKGDSFELDFAFSPEFNQTAVVEPDGYASLKELGSIHVEGATVPELTETLKAAYSKILHDPVLVIHLKDFEKPFFIASGQVGHPGRYDLRGPLTVTEAVAIAGGFNENSKHSQVVLFRPTTDNMFEAKLLDIKKLLATRNLSEDIYLQPGDLVYVPQNVISKIRKFMPNSVVGAYYNPNTF